MKILKDWHKTHQYIEFKILPGRDYISDESDMFEKFQLYHMYGNCIDDNTYEVWYEFENSSEEKVIEISQNIAKENRIEFKYLSKGSIYTREIKLFLGSKKEFKKEKSKI